MTGQPKSKNAKESAFKGSEQRYLPRWEVENRVVCRLGEEKRSIECLSKDLSCSGTCIKSEEKLEAKSKVKLTIFLSKETSVQVEGEIVWNKPSDGKSLSGVVCANTSEKVQQVILNYAFEMKREDLINHWYKGWNSKN